MVGKLSCSVILVCVRPTAHIACRASLAALQHAESKLALAFVPVLLFDYRMCCVGSRALGGEERRAAADKLLRTSDCCLDPGLGKKLKARFGTVDRLMEEDVQRFLRTLFERVILSTAFVECTFASFRRWLLKAGTSVGGENIAARHTLKMFRWAMEKMVPGCRVGKSVVTNKRKRPPWIDKAKSMAGYGRGITGKHVFSSEWMSSHGPDLAAASRAWYALTLAEKSRYKALARGRRAMFHEVLDPVKLANSALDEVRESSGSRTPWGLGNKQWPLRPELIQEALRTPGFIKTASHEWCSFTGQKFSPDPRVPDKINYPEYCLKKISECVGSFGDGVLELGARLLGDLKLVVCPRRSLLTPGQYVLIEYRESQQVLLVLSYLKSPFTFECIGFPVRARGTEVQGEILSLRPQLSSNSGLWSLPIKTEVEWAAKVVESMQGDYEASNVKFTKLFVKCPAPEEGERCLHLGRVVVTGKELVDLEEVREQQRSEDAIHKALKALEKSQQPWTDRKRPKRTAKEGREQIAMGSLRRPEVSYGVTVIDHVIVLVIVSDSPVIVIQ